MRACLIAPSPTSPVLNALNFPSAMLFRGSLIFFMPPLTRVTLPAHQPQDVGLTSRSLGACPLLLPLARHFLPVGERRRFALALAACPLRAFLLGAGRDSAASVCLGHHLRNSAALNASSEQRRVPATATPCGGTEVFTSGGAPAPRPGASAARPTRSRGASPSHPPRGRPHASAGSGHCGRHSGPPAPCARESPSLSPVEGHFLWVEPLS